jgi:hypothetical protein
MDEHTDGDTDGLRTLALRLLRGTSGDALQNLHLLPGELPPALPFAVLVPPGARVWGSLAGGRVTQVALDTDLPPQRALAYYQEQLPAAGWNEPERSMGVRTTGGFLHTVGPTPERLLLWFSREAWGLAVEVGTGSSPGASGAGDGATGVHLTFYADGLPGQHQQPRGPRRSQQAHHERFITPGKLVPLLIPPAGARQRMDGSGGGSSQDWRTSALLVTALDLSAVASHYAQQLSEAGWTRQGAGESGGMQAWSAWDFVDEEREPWRGLLTALRWPVAPEAAPEPGGVLVYLLELRLLWAGGEPDV